MTWNIRNLYKYPEIRQFLIGKKLDIKNNSYLSEAINRNYQRLEFIEYFLKHSKDLVIHNNFRDKLFQYLVKECADVQDKKDLESLLAELEAFYLLQNKFGLNIGEYEPQLCGQKKKPDFKVEFDNLPVYFEVKCRCNVDVQRIPEKINKYLDRIELEYKNKYVISIVEIENSEDKNKCPNYQKLFGKHLCDPDILKSIEKEIKERLKLLEHTNILTQQNRNTSGVQVRNVKAGNEKVNIHFLICLRQNKGQKRPWYFDPDDIEDVEEWFFAQVKQAESKGADYLLCKIDAWKHKDETFYDYIRPLFCDIRLIKDYYAESNDPKLGTKLSGVFFFCSSASLLDNYIIISNAIINPKIKEWVFKA